jgi:hypothetical protein
MARRTNRPAGREINSARLAVVLDKLVAIDFDLEPIARPSGERAPVIASPDAIADACDILRSAIVDLRNIIHEIDGLTQRP